MAALRWIAISQHRAATHDHGADTGRWCRSQSRKTRKSRALGKIIGLILLGLAFHCLVPGIGAAADDWFAKIVSIQGSVEIKHRQDPKWHPAATGQKVFVDDMVRVGPHSRAALVFRDKAVIRLDQNTTVSFRQNERESESLLELLRGALHFFSTDPSHLKVITPFVNAAIEGTEFVIRVGGEKTEVSVLEGRIRADNPFGTMVVEQGQSAVATATRPPELRLVLKPRDAVNWTLYYPPIIDLTAFALEPGTGPATRAAIQNAYQDFLSSGNTNSALLALGKVPAEQRDISFLLCRSALLLAAGAVEEARADLRLVFERNPGEATALALEAIIALTQDDKKRALELANEAVRAGPDSAAAAMALSYVRQAYFEISHAAEIIRSLTEKHPDNALAWARLSDLELAQGRMQDALQAADRAAALNPKLELVQTVLGFAYLNRIKIKQSLEAFQKAIQLNPVDPLPRLGLGLAQIRKGDLRVGRQDLEIAVALDPLNSLFRSYLGKAYYEEKRAKKAGEQLGIAKQLDPKDPTPWFYDAILKQSINRPVEALHDLQESIALNDNRAVYRSQLLLDQDLASRSASLARIYSDIGFEQLALVEGWRSVNTDPSNFSAHRFLADSYSALPRHEIARVSELLQAQLLQPININPLQPQLAESNLSVFQGTGPANSSFSEYSSLFNRNGTTMQVSTTFGEDGTAGDEVVLSGIQNNVSFSLGQYHYQTDGFRENDDLTQEVYNAFLQVSLTPQTSVQTEYRYNDQQNGDLSLLFDPDFYRQNQREGQQTDSFRLGLHHTFSPQAQLLGSFIYRDLDGNTDMSNIWYQYGLDESEEGWSGEAQFQYQTLRASWITGAGYFDGDSKEVVTNALTTEYLPTLSRSAEDRVNILQSNAYVYSLIHGLGERLTFTLGSSLDRFDGTYVSRDQFNPKFGLSFDLTPKTTFRTAVFRTLKRQLLTDQTVEPTQVAGFNQFYDDPNGTSAWRYGVALDRQMRPDLFGGIELSERDLDDVPYVVEGALSTEVKSTSMHEKMLRAYLYWAARQWLTLTLEAQIEDFDRSPEYVGKEYYTKLRTVKIPFGLSFYHPSGFSLQLKATVVDQSGTFYSNGTATPQDDSDLFMVLDASISYRMPKRLGTISLGVKNLWNQDILFQDTDPANPDIYPERLVYAKITLVF